MYLLAVFIPNYHELLIIEERNDRGYHHSDKEVSIACLTDVLQICEDRCKFEVVIAIFMILV